MRHRRFPFSSLVKIIIPTCVSQRRSPSAFRLRTDDDMSFRISFCPHKSVSISDVLSLTLMLSLVPLLGTSPAEAQAMRTYISGTGSDANACTFSKPCQTLQAALNKTLRGGQVQS